MKFRYLLIPLAFLVFAIAINATPKSEVCAGICPQQTSTPTATPTVSAEPSPTPEPICNRHCVQDSDCSRYDASYICYTKTQECRQIHNSEDINCNPRDPEPEVVLPDLGVQPLGVQK